MIDVFFICDGTSQSTHAWENLKSTVPRATKLTSILDAQKKSFTKLFWVVWPDITVDKNFKFDYCVPEWDQNYTHVFLNGKYNDGICIIPKSASIANREIDYRFFTNRKDIPLLASTPAPYDIFFICNNTAKSTVSWEFLVTRFPNATKVTSIFEAQEQSATSLFWVVWPDVILNDIQFDYQVPAWDQRYVHVFQNGDFYDGVCIISKTVRLSKREADYRFFTNKKEIDIQLSLPVPYDIFFISYNEPNAEENYTKLLSRFPRAKRIHGITGIHNAHREAAIRSTTDMFWVVDADANVLDTFNFDYQIPFYDTYSKKTVHVWRSQNPINNLEYGYGGVKLLPTDLSVNMDMSKPDMSTSISTQFKVMNELSNITAFNVDEFTTWRSAFRECVKLSSRVIDRTLDQETQARLDTWCNVANGQYSAEALSGAVAGVQYGNKYKNDVEALKKINDFNWLKEKFNEHRRIST